ncbi:9974_t:CDS:2, partial [Funneliformis geosporum]
YKEEFLGGETAYEGKVCRSCLGKKKRGETTSPQAQNQRVTDEPPFYMNRDYGFKESRKVNSSGKKILLRELRRKQSRKSKTMKVQVLNNPGAGLTSTIPFTGREGSEPDLQVNLGEQQRQQVREVTSQLVGNILDNQNNFSQLTTNPNGARRNIDEIEEIFLSGSLNQQPQSPTTPAPTQITNSLSFEVIEQKLEKIKGDYNKLLEEYLRVIQELKTIKELFEKYSQIRTNLVINKVDRSKELIGKGIGTTNTLSVSSRETSGGGKKGNARGLSLFLKPHNRENYKVYFPENIVEEQQNTVRQLISNLLDKSQKIGKEVRGNDIYILRVGSKEREGTISGLSSGVAHYLALYSALNKIPLPRNLASTGTVEGEKVGSIGGLKYKLQAAVDKEKPIDTFILSEANKSVEAYKKFKPGYVPKYPDIDSYENIEKNSLSLTAKIKQVHFVSQVDQIETALQEILKNPNEKVIHSCGEIPEKKPEKPKPQEPPKPDKPNSEITSEQLLALIAELSIRDNKGENQDF